ncbi:MAG: hypothetical protein AAF543_04320 [Pseudomonadota bacterium]
MTIDPMAAVTSATSGAGGLAAGADPATSNLATANTQTATAAQRTDQTSQMDLFDYTSKQQNKAPAIETLQPEGKAKYLSNPAALGEKVLQRMEGLHQRSLDYQDVFRNGGTSSTTAGAAGGGDPAMAGPASTNVAGTAEPNTFSGLKLAFDYAIETTLISNSSSRFTTAVNTLMRGQ